MWLGLRRRARLDVRLRGGGEVRLGSRPHGSGASSRRCWRAARNTSSQPTMCPRDVVGASAQQAEHVLAAAHGGGDASAAAARGWARVNDSNGARRHGTVRLMACSAVPGQRPGHGDTIRYGTARHGSA